MRLTIFLVLVLVFAPQALAQDVATGDSSVRIKIKNEINTGKEVRQGIKTEIRSKISAVRRERIRSHFGRMIIRIEATIERIEKLIERIESRIGDNSKVQETVNKAKTELAKAKLELATLKLQLENLLDSDDPKLVFNQIQDSLKVIKDYLRKTHVLLVQSIGELKGLRVGEDKE